MARVTTAGGLVLAGLAIPIGVLVLAGLILLVAAAVSGGRAQSDPTGERSRAIFLGITTWLALFSALFATFAVVVAIARYIGSDLPQRVSVSVPFQPGLQTGGISGGYAFSGPGSSPVLLQRAPTLSDHVVSTALGAGLVALAAGVVLAVYGRRLWGLVSSTQGRPGPGDPPVRIYVLAVVFTAVFIAVFSGASVLFGLYRAVAPGVAGLGAGHGPGLRQLVDSAYLGAGALVIWRFHHRWAFPPSPPDAPDGALGEPR